MPSQKLWRKSLGERGLRVYLFERTPGGTLYREVYIGGKRIAAKKSLRHRDKERAEADGYTLLAKLKSREEVLQEGKLTLSALFDIYVVSVAHGTKKERTRREDEAKLRRILGFFGEDRTVDLLSGSDTKRYEAARRTGQIGMRPVRARAVAADLSALRAMLNWATQERTSSGVYLLERNPLAGVSLPVEKNPVQPVAEHERYESTLAVAHLVNPFLPLMLVLANEAGHRNGSVRKLRRSDLHLEAFPGAITWREESDKQGYRWERTPISEAARHAIDVHLRQHAVIGDAYLFPSPRKRGEPYSRAGVRRWLLQAEKLAGLPKMKGGLWHPYRRKFATDMVEVPDRITAKLGGWKSPRTLDLYQQPAEATLRQALERRNQPQKAAR